MFGRSFRTVQTWVPARMTPSKFADAPKPCKYRPVEREKEYPDPVFVDGTVTMPSGTKYRIHRQTGRWERVR